MWKTLLLILVLGGLLAATIWGLPTIFFAFGPQMSVHGWIALAAGTILSIALGCGLMALSFFSARGGYDDRADWRDGQNGTPPGENDPPSME